MLVCPFIIWSYLCTLHAAASSIPIAKHPLLALRKSRTLVVGDVAFVQR